MCIAQYNGCSWKGGKLKLEKAKEHYADRLKREWAEDAELQNSAHDHGDVDGNIVASVEPKGNLDLEKAQIHIFFPKLRKVTFVKLNGLTEFLCVCVWVYRFSASLVGLLKGLGSDMYDCVSKFNISIYAYGSFC